MSEMVQANVVHLLGLVGQNGEFVYVDFEKVGSLIQIVANVERVLVGSYEFIVLCGRREFVFYIRFV